MEENIAEQLLEKLNENGLTLKFENEEQLLTVKEWLKTMDNKFKVEQLQLSERAVNCLERHYGKNLTIELLVETVMSGEIKDVKYLGKLGIEEVTRKLVAAGFIIRAEIHRESFVFPDIQLSVRTNNALLRHIHRKGLLITDVDGVRRELAKVYYGDAKVISLGDKGLEEFREAYRDAGL